MDNAVCVGFGGGDNDDDDNVGREVIVRLGDI